jgi:hypothetical protein
MISLVQEHGDRVHTLSEDCVHHENNQGEEGGRSNDEPHDVTDQNPGEEGADIVHVEGPSTPDGEPFKMDLESRPSSCCGGQKLLLCRAVEVRHLRETVQDVTADCGSGILRSRLYRLCVRRQFSLWSRRVGSRLSARRIADGAFPSEGSAHPPSLGPGVRMSYPCTEGEMLQSRRLCGWFERVPFPAKRLGCGGLEGGGEGGEGAVFMSRGDGVQQTLRSCYATLARMERTEQSNGRMGLWQEDGGATRGGHLAGCSAKHYLVGQVMVGGRA